MKNTGAGNLETLSIWHNWTYRNFAYILKEEYFIKYDVTGFDGIYALRYNSYAYRMTLSL